MDMKQTTKNEPTRQFERIWEDRNDPIYKFKKEIENNRENYKYDNNN